MDFAEQLRNLTDRPLGVSSVAATGDNQGGTVDLNDGQDTWSGVPLTGEAAVGAGQPLTKLDVPGMGPVVIGGGGYWPPVS